GLMLAHLLHNAGIDSVVIDNRSRDDIAHTHRAGILEAGSVRMLEAAGVESRVHTAGHRHDGITIRVDRSEERRVGKESSYTRSKRDWSSDVCSSDLGLMLAHLLHNAGIDSVVIDNRSRDDIAHTHRAGILEAGSVRMLEAAGVESRVHTAGHRHDGITIRVDGTSHLFDFPELAGESAWP